MLGKYEIEIKNRKINYKFSIKRKITILTGNSGTGKTKLSYLISRKNLDRSIKVISDINIFNLEYDERYTNTLKSVSNSIIIIDEEHPIYLEKFFSKMIKESDNYFIFITRDRLGSLPYSHKEIYELSYNKKNNTNYFSRVYKDFENEKIPIYKDDKLLIEDSKSGFQMYNNISNIYGYNVYSSNGNSKIKDKLDKENYNLIIADGAAFGSYIKPIYDSIIINKKVNLFLPESFEYLLLKIYFKNEFSLIETKLFDFIDSNKYFSWEIYFDSLLKELCKNKLKINYKKESINKYFLDNVNIFIEGIKDSLIFINFEDREITNLNWE